MKTHQEIDRRALALHRLIAAKIRQNPALLGKAKLTLLRWKKIVHPSSHPYLNEWQRLVDSGSDTCVAVMIEDSEYAANLRQSSPFTGILTNKERFLFFKQWSDGS